MSKLKLINIEKTYKSGEIVNALRDVSLEFRESELVSILGPSGCGKTTMLNIIGGLDRYDSGDLVLGDLSTKNFKDSDWDAYRNRSIGFVFQNYNLIGHQSILQNVEISMTISGISASERKQRAKEALASVGLSDQIYKKPNQLSGGQMQRVAIARALVNNPDIVLADEPTGALDSRTSVQVMDILREISKTRLVIMVTHNDELASQYSSRIIRLRDGEVQSDSNPLFKDEIIQNGKTKKQGKNTGAVDKKTLTKTSMSLFTATTLSFKNLLTKKGRTMLTSFAGSIGIIGIALVLALSSGLTSYMNDMQSDTLSGFPITISTAEQSIRMGKGMSMVMGDNEVMFEEYTDEDILYNYDSSENDTTHKNVLTQNYFDYIDNLETELPDTVNTISYSRGVGMNLLAKGEDTVVKFEPTHTSGDKGAMVSAMGMGNSYLQEMPDNKEFILTLYDLIGEESRMPEAENEVVLVVDEYNRIDNAFFEMLGITSDTGSYKLTDFIGQTILKVVPNDDYYTKNGELFTVASPADYESIYESESGIELTITGILRIKEDAATSYLSAGIAYTTTLTDYVVENAQNSEIAAAQRDSDINVQTGAPFANDTAKEESLLILGADTTPTAISIYPTSFESKDKIKEYLDAYNEGKGEADQVVYTDMAETISSMTGSLVNTVSYVLIAFAAISLLVSTIMIAIITYVSVIERTKEIGILRSVGARKKDISRVFTSEALIIGFCAGTLGVLLSYLLTIPVNAIISNLVGIGGIASLSPVSAVVLVLGSVGLTLIAGFFPSRVAAKKDPVIALRTE